MTQQLTPPTKDFFASSPVSSKSASQPQQQQQQPNHPHPLSPVLVQVQPHVDPTDSNPLFFQDDQDETHLEDQQDFFSTLVSQTQPLAPTLPAESSSSSSRQPSPIATPTPFSPGSSKRKQFSPTPQPSVKEIKRSKKSPSPSTQPARALVSAEPSHDRFARRYIGTFALSAWSTSKGNGYIKVGDPVSIFRPRKKSQLQQQSSIAAQNSNAASKEKIGSGKQTKLTFGIQSSTSNNKSKGKENQDYIVRFSNMRGFEVGRMLVDVASWMSRLLDNDMVEFQGTVVDCPPSLTVGCDIILQVKAYLRYEAFATCLNPLSSNKLGSQNAGLRPETAETEMERALRERKGSLLRLFRACDLKPSKSNSLLKNHKDTNDLGSEAMLEQFGGDIESSVSLPRNGHPADDIQSATPAPRSSPPASSDFQLLDNELDLAPIELIDQDGELKPITSIDNEPNDGTEITINQVDNVYHKAQMHDAELPEVEPPDSFALQLRPYQKQALGWMKAMEIQSDQQQQQQDGSAEQGGNAGKEPNLHPLWEEYEFPLDYDDLSAANEDLITSKTRSFYFSPYTGDLSLEFQRANKGSRGGILADEMGLGKTIMVASLIHANREPEPGEETDDEQETADMQDDGQAHDLVTSRLKRNHRASGTNGVAKQTSLASAFAASTSSDRKALLRASISKGRASLVVAPMSLIGQWRDELTRASQPGTLTPVLYYAESKADIIAQLESGQVDVVITSYGTLVAEYKRYLDAGGPSSRNIATIAPLFCVQWLRIILDEAHNIKNRSTVAAKACYELHAYRRWCLTGTPIINRLTDLFSLLKFLRFQPWSDFSFFNSFISKPFANRNPKALEIVQVILSSCLLRREKKTKDKDGNPIVQLPEKFIEVSRLDFTEVERRIYDNVFKRAHLQYAQMKRDGTITKNFSLIFSVLMRLRQAVCHPLLVLGKNGGKGNIRNDTVNGEGKERNDQDPDSDQEEFAKLSSDMMKAGDGEEDLEQLIAEFQSDRNILSNGNENENDSSSLSSYASQTLEKLLASKKDIQLDEEEECPICFEPLGTRPSILYLGCMHRGCKPCMFNYITTNSGSCPTCRVTSSINDLIETLQTPTPIHRRFQPFQTSSKLSALLDQLNHLRLNSSSTYPLKGVIFSQFTSFLSLLEPLLQRDKHSYLRLDGSTCQSKRETILQQFSSSSSSSSNSMSSPSLLLVSLKAAGTGLNLTTANRIWLLDFWWNSSIENQAIDRIHRLGQTKPVYVYRSIINDSIEDRILLIQKRKELLIQNALVSNSSLENRKEMYQNLDLLFGSRIPTRDCLNK